ncbi:Oidioi.mRNA.OKI2018_I69.chr1.g3939.t1.cds [Oikopleura dioica]|uniref:Oidioi.mRNA.OKI2018_I69.chr1.g3939.t1.cds n=1 Tax=Oikopleura dioica TaxID=34765 RepID=A0ABN7T183_OIKDI|nr:Oidioi.mRNA.OKI2018_I69.chr1.g3939.t1.cds [Oikopleura dioica]
MESAPRVEPPPPPPVPSFTRQISIPVNESGLNNDPSKIAKAAIEARETGILNLSNCGLRKFPIGVIKLAGPEVKRINLSGNQLESLPTDFKKYSKLEHLNLERNLFSRFPVAMVELPDLKVINLSNNCFEELSAEHLDRFSGNAIVDLRINKLTAEAQALASNYSFIQF